MSNSKEVNTIRMSRNLLRIGFKADILTLASSLASENIITEKVYETATTPGKEESDKTEAMVKAVLQAVSLDVNYYHKMMEILKQKREYNALVRKLNEEYKIQGGTITYEPCNTEYVQVKMPTKHKKLQIIQEAAFHWEKLADQLGFSPGVIANIKNPGMGKTPEQCFKEVLTKWLENAGKMPMKNRYPCTWEGLYNLLEDTDQSSLANDLNEAIEAEYGDLQDTYKLAPKEGTTSASVTHATTSEDIGSASTGAGSASRVEQTPPQPYPEPTQSADMADGEKESRQPSSAQLQSSTSSSSSASEVLAKRFSFRDCEKALKEDFQKLLQQFHLESEKLEKSSPTEEQLRKLSKLQGSEWIECATALKIATNDIDDIKSNHEKDVKEQRYRALLHWKKKNGFKASYAVLVKAFISVARMDLAECICELFCE